MAASTARAQVPVTDNRCPPDLERPCVALVLAGGGARGGAHAGVLEVLESRGVPIDIVVGTSIGAFVGGLYASGRSAAEIRRLFEESDWNTGYRDDLDRSEMPTRRKQQIDDFPVQLDIGLSSRGVSLPLGLIQGQGMKALVDGMLGFFPQFTSFDDLPIPFRAVAADIETGEAVVLSDGDLANALQGSMSLPGILRPIERDGRLLVDGGIANNLPVDVAKSMGADVVIAVDIASELLSQDDLQSGVTIVRQLSALLTRNNVNYQRSLLDSDDILIQPRIEGVTVSSFDRIAVAVQAGVDAATAAFAEQPHLAALQGLRSATPSAVAASVPGEVRIDALSLQNRSRLSDFYILDRMELAPGNTYSPSQIQQAISRLYGQGSFARIYTSVETTNVGNILQVEVAEKEWGPGYLNFKLGFEDDFSSFSRYQIGASHRRSNLSPWNAEWYSWAYIGTDKAVHSDIYWPLRNTGYFWNLAGDYVKRDFPYLLDGASIGDVQSRELRGTGRIGLNVTDRLEVSLGAVRIDGVARLPKVLAELVGLGRIDYDQSGGLLRVYYDSLDDAMFPTRGWRFESEIIRSRDQYLDINTYTTRIDNEFNRVYSRGRHTLRGVLRYQSFLNEDPLSILGNFQLGGFLNLSGLPKDSLSGQHVRFGGLIYTYELAANDFGAIRLPLYLGASYETGNTWNRKADVDYGDLLDASSIFIGWNSPLGPAYLAYGSAGSDADSFYLFLGLTF
jgi:NTE family protein